MTRREFLAKLATCRTCRRNRLIVALAAAAVVLLAACGTAPTTGPTPAPTTPAAAAPTTAAPAQAITVTCAILDTTGGTDYTDPADDSQVIGDDFRLWVQATQTVSVSDITLIVYDAAGGELGSTVESIGEVIAAGQTLTFWFALPYDFYTVDTSTWLGSLGGYAASTNAASCQSAGWD